MIAARSIGILFLILSLVTRGNASDPEQKALREGILRLSSRIRSEGTCFAEAVNMADLLGRCTYFIEHFPETTLSKELLSGEARLGTYTLNECRNSIFPRMANCVGANEDPLIDACLLELSGNCVDDNGHRIRSVPFLIEREDWEKASLVLRHEMSCLRDYNLAPDRYSIRLRDVVDGYIMLGECGIAEQLLNEYCRNSRTRYNLDFIDAYFQIGKPDVAVKIFDVFFEEKPHTDYEAASSFCWIAKEYMRSGFAGKAEQALDIAAESLKTTDAYVYAAHDAEHRGEASEIASLYFDLFKPDKATEVLDCAVHRVPEIERIHWRVYELVSLAKTCREIGYTNRAFSILNAAQGNASLVNNADAKITVASAYVDLGRSEAAIAMLDAIHKRIVTKEVKKERFRVYELVCLARGYILAGDCEAAVKILDSCMMRSSDIEAGFFRRDLLLRIAEEYVECYKKEGLDSVSKTINSLHSNDPVQIVSDFINLAILYLKVCSHEDAIALLNKAEALSELIKTPYVHAKVLVEISLLYRKAGCVSAAEDALNRATDLIKSENNLCKKRDGLLLIVGAREEGVTVNGARGAGAGAALNQSLPEE